MVDVSPGLLQGHYTTTLGDALFNQGQPFESVRATMTFNKGVATALATYSVRRAWVLRGVWHQGGDPEPGFFEATFDKEASSFTVSVVLCCGCGCGCGCGCVLGLCSLARLPDSPGCVLRAPSCTVYPWRHSMASATSLFNGAPRCCTLASAIWATPATRTPSSRPCSTLPVRGQVARTLSRCLLAAAAHLCWCVFVSHPLMAAIAAPAQPALRNELLSCRLPSGDEPGAGMPAVLILRELQRLYTSLSMSQRTFVDPSVFHGKLPKDLWGNKKQQDSYEFLVYMWDVRACVCACVCRRGW